jgi:hypothetical protein
MGHRQTHRREARALINDAGNHLIFPFDVFS